MEKEILIFGAGKIGRGFIGQLFFSSSYKLWFVDAFDGIVSGLNKSKKYRIDIAGEETDSFEYIEVEGAILLEDMEEIQKVFNRIEIIAVSVGANNLKGIAYLIKSLLRNRDKNRILNCLICENANKPGALVKKILLEGEDQEAQEFIMKNVGIVETQILRTGMQARPEILEKEPLALRMQDWWTLPIDKDAFVGEVPDVEGLMPKSNFGNELTRKIYTFNGTNGPISYIGWANGFRILHESANSMRSFFDDIQEESLWGLINEFGFDDKEQRNFMALAMKKYTDPALNDKIERNARDLKRKVGKEERLVGPALLCLKHGRLPVAYAKAIAAAYSYDGSDDEGTIEVRNFLEKNGIEKTIKKFSNINENSELFGMVIDAYQNKTYILSVLS